MYNPRLKMELSGGMRRLLIIVHPYLSEVVRGELLCLTYNLPLFSQPGFLPGRYQRGLM